jgi:transposase InsO family protein
MDGLPSVGAIGRWLKTWGLSRKRRRARHRGRWIERPALTVARGPNDVWSVDFKGWFRTSEGRRVEPLTVRDMASRYVVAVVVMPRIGLEETRGAFMRIFRRFGLPQAIRVDNGTPFGAQGALGLTRLSAWWVKLGIRVEFIAPGRPDQNGSHEQMHRVYKAETLGSAPPTLRAQQRRSERWLRIYNHERPHESLDMASPAELYRRSRRKMPRKLRPWTYAPGWQSRLVKGKGMISLYGVGRYVGEAFEGERVGLKPNGASGWDVHFGPLLIGKLHRHELSGIHAAWYRHRGKRGAPNQLQPSK